jgi:hypothetical protein
MPCGASIARMNPEVQHGESPKLKGAVRGVS